MDSLRLIEKYDYIPRQPIEIMLNSKQAVEINGKNGHIYWDLDTPITARKDERILFYLKKCFIPFSFYTCNNKNNKLDVKEIQSDSTENIYSITIDNGNYNISELLSEIKTSLESNSTFNYKYSLTYNDATSKVKCILLSGDLVSKSQFLFNTGSNKNISCRNLLGFNEIDIEFTTSNNSISNNIVDMADGLDSIHIKSNLVGNNIQSSSEGAGELLIVPVDLEPNSILYFDEGANPFKHLINEVSFSRFEIKMTDSSDNIIDFNNIPFTLICIAEFIFNPLNRLTTNTLNLESEKNQKNQKNNNEILARKLLKNKNLNST